MKKQILLGVATVLSVLSASAANKTWIGGAEGQWETPENWDPNGLPTKDDTVFFDSTDPITVLLGDSQIFATLSVSNTPCLFFKGVESGSTLQAQQDSKWTLYAPIVFDEHTYVKFLAGKVWTNNSRIEFLGGVGNSTPTLGGSGQYVVRGPVDFQNGVKFSAPIDWNPSSVTESTYYTIVGGCDLQYNCAPAVERSRMRAGGGVGGFGGSAPLCLKSADGTKPAFVVNQYANPTFYLRRTMPTVIEDRLSLCSSSTAYNNAKVGFSLGSGAELRIPGLITGNSGESGTAGNDDYGFTVKFNGCGATLSLTGDNPFPGKGGNSMSVSHAGGVGYNSILIDGSENEIHPFGAGDVYSNEGNGIFIKALSPGKTLVNGFSYGNSVNNNNAYTFGFDGTNDLTVAGNFTLGTAYSMIPVIGDMTLTLTGTLNPKAKNFDFVGTGDVVLGPTSHYTGSTGTLNKHSAGDLTLQGKLEGETYNKAYFSGGKTTLDYTVGEASSRLNTANSGTALTDALRLRGTELVLKGGAVAETVGEGNGTTFQNGLTKIRREGGTSTIYLGKFTSTPTGAQGTTAAVLYEDGIATVDPSQAGKLLNGHHQVGDHFAKTTEDGVITAAADDESGDTTKIVAGQSTSRLVNNLFVIEPESADQTITLTAATAPMVANWNGMIFRGPYDFTVAGGQFGGSGTSNSALIFNHCGTGVFTIDSELFRSGFTKIGPGTVRMTGTSTLSQSLNIYEGVFEVASENGFSPASKGSYQVYLNGGTLKTSVDVELVRPMSVGDNGGVIDVAEGTTFTQTGNIVHTTDNTCGPVVKKGEGTWVPSNDFQAQGKVRIEAGMVRLGAANGLGDSSARTRAIAPTELVGGTLDVAGFAAKLGNFYLKGGTVDDSSEGKTGSLAAYTHFVEEGTVNVALADGVHQNASCYFNSTNLKKYGPGTVTLNAANTFTGAAYVEEGTLDLTGSLAGGACVEGGVLTGTGPIAGYVYVTGNGVFAPKSGATIALGSQLAVENGGTVRIGADSKGATKLELTSGNVYLGEDSRLEFDLGRGGIFQLNGKVVIQLPEGAEVVGSFSNFEGGKYVDERGNSYTISYTAGDGNDIAVTGHRGLCIFLR